LSDDYKVAAEALSKAIDYHTADTETANSVKEVKLKTQPTQVKVFLSLVQAGTSNISVS